MNTYINRREFVAISAAASAASAISSSALAESITPISTATKALKIPSPSLAHVIQSEDNPAKARLLPNARFAHPTKHTTTPQNLTLTPLPCVDGRLDTDASITIELHYPTPNLYSTLYQAHNITLQNKSIPSYASATQAKAPNATPTLKITQHTNAASKSTLITLSPGAHLLAVPTAPNSSKASFRFTAAHLDTYGNITKLTHPMPATSSRCAYFSINLSDKSTGE